MVQKVRGDGGLTGWLSGRKGNWGRPSDTWGRKGHRGKTIGKRKCEEVAIGVKIVLRLSVALAGLGCSRMFLVAVMTVHLVRE